MNGNIPEVSVVLLTYNQEKYISKSIESVITQKRNFPIEVLVGDDASVDSTPEIIKEYERRYPDIISAEIQQKNLGVVKHYFHKLRQCRGKYIMGVAGDDYWFPGKMQSQYDYMESHSEVGTIYGRAWVVDENGNDTGKIIGSDVAEYFDRFILGSDVPAFTACIRTSEVKKYLDEVMPEERGWLMEDYPMLLWFSKQNKIRFVDSAYGAYRELKGSISHPASFEKQMEYLNSVNDIRFYFAGSDEHVKKQVASVYFASVAGIYFDMGDMGKFREYNRKSGRRKDQIKNMISYLPKGEQLLRKLMR